MGAARTPLAAAAAALLVAAVLLAAAVPAADASAADVLSRGSGRGLFASRVAARGAGKKQCANFKDQEDCFYEPSLGCAWVVVPATSSDFCMKYGGDCNKFKLKYE